MSGAWKYPPRKPNRAEKRREAFILALWATGIFVFVAIAGALATKAISQAAFGAVHSQYCIQEGC